MSGLETRGLQRPWGLRLSLPWLIPVPVIIHIVSLSLSEAADREFLVQAVLLPELPEAEGGIGLAGVRRD